MSALRFSIRDLLWLTLVIALGLAWFVREGTLSAKEATIDQALQEAKLWQSAAQALECALVDYGYKVTWQLPDWRVKVAPATEKVKGTGFNFDLTVKRDASKS